MCSGKPTGVVYNLENLLKCFIISVCITRGLFKDFYDHAVVVKVRNFKFVFVFTVVKYGQSARCCSPDT